MSWNMLAYAVPLFGGCKTFVGCLPQAYRSYEDAPESTRSQTVKEIINRILHTEIQPGSAYQERIQEMVQELPDSVSSKNIDSLIATRIKVVSMTNERIPIHSTGTDLDWGAQGKYFINIDPNMERTAIEALPWIVTHEVCHLFEEDWIKISVIKTIASLSATILSTFVFGWGLPASICAAMAANIVTHTVLSHRVENRADDFANRHCTEKEREKAIEYLEQVKHSRPQGMAGYLGKIVRSALHPSENARIAKILGTLSLAENLIIA